MLCDITKTKAKQKKKVAIFIANASFIIARQHQFASDCDETHDIYQL